MVLDFYPIEDWNGNIIPDRFLRILSFMGQTQTKRVVSRETMTEDVRHRVDECDYVVRDDQFRFPQYVGSLKYVEV